MLLRHPKIGGLGNEVFTAYCTSGYVNITGVPEPALVDSMVGISQWQAANCRTKAWVAAQKAPAPAPTSSPPAPAPAPAPTPPLLAPAQNTPTLAAQTQRAAYIPTYQAMDDTSAPAPTVPGGTTTTYSLVPNAPLVSAAPAVPLTDDTADTSQIVAPVVASSGAGVSPLVLLALAGGALLLLSGKKS